VKEQFQLKEGYRANFEHLLVTADVPLKLLLYKNMLDLLQEIVVDRKKLFIVTNGDPAQQLNKIKHTDWNGLEQYLICYFANETSPKPEPDVIHLLLKEHNLLRRDLMMIGNSKTDELCAQAIGVDYMNAMQFL
jgi:phosphoglycolate phosphatase-like HAD superfamily hydrolase